MGYNYITETSTWQFVPVTTSFFDNLTNAITGNLAVIIPVAVGLLGIILAVSLIPRIVYKFF